MRPRTLCVLALGAVLLAPVAVHAQDAPDALLREAYALRRAGDDAAARPLLERAVAAGGGPRAEAQLGLCAEALGTWPEAERHLRAALAAPEDPWIARNLAALEGAYTLVLAHLPRERTALRVVRIAPHAPSAPSAGPSHVVPIAVMAGGGALVVGGLVAWGARELVVDGFNARGCRIGDPQLPADCNVAGAQTGRDVATTLAATGLVAGAGLAAVGVVLVVTGHAPGAPRGGFACGPGPGTIGASCAVRF